MNFRRGILRVVRFGAIAILTIFIVTSVTVQWVVARRGVTEVPIPVSSLIHAQLSPQPDYVDSYRAPIAGRRITDIADVNRVAFQKGIPAGESPTELVFQDVAPGLIFHISYLLDRPENPTSIQVSTVVHYTSRRGALYFGLVRPIHSVGVPLMVSQMVRE